MDPPTREILDWVSAYLVSNPRLDRLFANFAQCEDVELLSENAQREWGNRMTFNVLNSYEEQGLLGDWTAPPADAPVNDPGDLCSWDILEGRACAMPQSWDSGHKSDLFNLCLELRIQSVLCCHQSGRDLDEAQWKRAVARAFTPLGGGCRDTRAKNKVLRDKKLLLEKYGKPEHRQALRQFAVNHSLEDAKKRLHTMLPELAKAFPKPFLQQVFDDMRSGAYRPGARVDEGGTQPQLQPRPNKAESISGAPDGETAVASPAVAPPQQRLRPGGTATLRGNDTSGGSSIGAAALPARNFSLEELSSGNEASFIQIWERKHPEVHAWLKVSQPQSQPQRRDAPTRPCGTRSAAIADEHRHESSSESNSRHDGAASTQHLHELRDHSDRLKQVGGRDPLQETLSALQNGGSNCASAFRSPIYNKKKDNARTLNWSEDEIEDEDENDDEQQSDPYLFRPALSLESPRQARRLQLTREELPAQFTRRKNDAPTQQNVSTVQSKRRRVYNRWTEEETQHLRHGFEKYGAQWEKILNDSAYDFNGRTGVNLKDRWRNINKNA